MPEVVGIQCTLNKQSVPQQECRRLYCVSGFDHFKGAAIRPLFERQERLGYLFDQFASRGILHLEDLIGLTPKQIFRDYKIPFPRRKLFFDRLKAFGFVLEHPQPYRPSSTLATYSHLQYK